jgi:hypothetical protein
MRSILAYFDFVLPGKAEVKERMFGVMINTRLLNNVRVLDAGINVDGMYCVFPPVYCIIIRLF